MEYTKLAGDLGRDDLGTMIGDLMLRGYTVLNNGWVELFWVGPHSSTSVRHSDEITLKDAGEVDKMLTACGFTVEYMEKIRKASEYLSRSDLSSDEIARLIDAIRAEADED